MEKECLEVRHLRGMARRGLLSALCESDERRLYCNDLSYGDSLWGSRRINRALGGLFNEYVLEAGIGQGADGEVFQPG